MIAANTNRLRMLGSLCLFLVFLLSSQPLRAEITASATLDSTTFSLDQTAQLTITVSGARSADIDIPEIDNLEISRRGQSSQLSMINGSISSSISVTYSIQAGKPGKYTLPPIKVSAGNTSLTTAALSFEVLAAGGRTGTGSAVSGKSDTADAAAGEIAFIRISELKENLYIGEVVPIRIKAYFRQGLRANLNSYPSLQGDGCVIPQLNGEPGQSRETIGGSAYTVLTWDTVLSTIKEGKHSLKLGLDATLLIPQRSLSTSVFGRQSPFDDDFFNGVFGGYQQKALHLTSKDLPITVLPLPAQGRPEHFTGAVGDFSLQASASPLQIELGEPINLTIKISGQGNFDRMEAPAFPAANDWKTYAPTAHFDKQSGDGISGTKTFEQALIVKNAGIREIPALSFSYFDPQKREYITRTSAPIAIQVAGKTTPPSQPAPPPAEQVKPAAQPLPKSDIEGMAPLILDLGRPVQDIKPAFRQTWFAALLIITLLWLTVLTILAIRRRHKERNPLLYRKRLMEKDFQETLLAIEQAGKGGDSGLFLARCRKLIQTQLGMLWQIEASAITLADLQQRLPASSGLIEIFSGAEQAAYSGSKLSTDQMQKYTNTIRKELGGLP
jgi:hypothetical protein